MKIGLLFIHKCIILKSHLHQALYYTLCIFIRNCIIPQSQVHHSSQHYSTLSTLLYILLYCATLHSLVLHCTLRDAKLCRTRLDCIHQLTTQHCTILHCTLYGTELYCTTLLCTRLLHYTALYYTIHYTLLNYSVQGFIVHYTPQWGAADAEIKVPSGENIELKRSPFIAWRQVSIQPYVLRLLPGISSLLISTLPVHSPAFFPKPLSIFSCVGFG